MELKIGVVHSAREIEMEINEDAAALAERVEQAITNAVALIWFTDVKARRVGVATDKLAYLEFGEDASLKRVGFGS